MVYFVKNPKCNPEMDRGRVSVLVYHGKPETSVQVRKGQLPRISEATSIGYELRSYRMDVVVHILTGTI